jgi:hypothetical protein
MFDPVGSGDEQLKTQAAMANYSKRDERRAGIVQKLRDTAAKPAEPKRETCAVCGAPAVIGVYTHIGLAAYYCAKHAPQNPI